MDRKILGVLIGCLLMGAAAIILARPGTSARGPVYHSPLGLALSPDHKALYVADHTADRVAAVEVATGKVIADVPVPAPTGCALSPDGKTLYVACSSLDRLYEIDTATRKTRGTLGVGRHPMGVTVSADGQKVYCCNQFSDDVSVVGVNAMAEEARIAVLREPRFAALSADGKTLVVSNHLPLGSNLDDSLGGVVSVVGLDDASVTNVQLSRGATDVGQVCCSPDGRWAYVVHVLARWLVPPTQLERGWVATNALTIVDVQSKRRVNTVLLDDLDKGAANPYGVALSADGNTLYVSHSGTNEIQIIDRNKLHKLVDEWPEDSPTALEDDLTAVYRAGVRRRVPSGGTGPRDLVPGPEGVFVSNYYSGTVTRLKAPAGKIVQTIGLGTQPQADKVRRGERLFNDANICFQQWQSCATCHPYGRTDGLAWDLLNDGMGNPKNAKSMFVSDRTPPVMASGVRASMEVAVESGLKFILFHMPQQDEIAHISAYLRAMKAERSPLRGPDGALSEAAHRGKKVFESPDVGCARCHPAPLFTDLKTYDVGTRHKYDHRSDFDTPTLLEMHRTAPFLHDGSAVTMREVLVEFNKEDKHGKTSHLSEQEIDDLNEYLLSL